MKNSFKIVLMLFVLLQVVVPTYGVDILTLGECRSLALSHNKAMKSSELSKEKAFYERKAAFSNYFPKIDFIGTYQRTSKQVSLLSDEQKTSLSGLGTGVVGGVQQAIAQSGFSGTMEQMIGQIIEANPDLSPLIMQGQEVINNYTQAFAQQAAQGLNTAGQHIVDALDTDTRNLGILSVMFTQPLYMGGKIRAYDKITHYSEELAGQKLRLEEQSLILDVDKAYWQVVSLVNKRKLAEGYRDMLQHLDTDVQKMIKEGVATKSNELSVSVKLNEAEMTLMRIDDGLILSRMLLAQTCGIPLGEEFHLADESLDGIAVELQSITGDMESAVANRPELLQLDLATQMQKEKVNIERSSFLPSLALTGGFLSTYPSLTNGFETRFRGMWNVGVSLKVPVWHWGEGYYKVKAAKVDAKLAELRYDEVKEKIQLQVKQDAFAVNEANRKLELALRNLEKAEENLRVARIGFSEGMVSTSDLLAAQTAWISAESDRVDAQIDIRLTQAAYNKSIGK